MERAKPPIRRCAVYTRKSSEEGLEQDFNSLHAQREACEAFIASQQGKGGSYSRPLTTMAAFRAQRWNVQRCNGCSMISTTG